MNNTNTTSTTPATPLNAREAVSKFCGTRVRLSEQSQAVQKCREDLGRIKQQLQVAIHEERFGDAANLKIERDAIEEALGNAQSLLMGTTADFNGDYRDMSQAWLKEHPVYPRAAKIYRVTVTDPVSGKSDNQIYTDCNDRLSLDVNGVKFEGTRGAYLGLGEWAMQHGFVVHVSDSFLHV